MKKSILFLAVSALIVSCAGETLQEKQDRLAQEFCNNKLKNIPEDAEVYAMSLTLKNRDTSRYLNSQELEYIKITELTNEYKIQEGYAESLMDIEEAYNTGDISPQTKQAVNKLDDLRQELQVELDRIAQLTIDDSAAYVVVYNADIKLSDATSIKEKNIPIVFYTDGELYGEVLNKAYKSGASFTK